MMESIKKLTDELITYCDKIGVDIVGFCDPTKFNKFDRKHNPELYMKNSKSVISTTP